MSKPPESRSRGQNDSRAHQIRCQWWIMRGSIVTTKQGGEYSHVDERPPTDHLKALEEEAHPLFCAIVRPEPCNRASLRLIARRGKPEMISPTTTRSSPRMQSSPGQRPLLLLQFQGAPKRAFRVATQVQCSFGKTLQFFIGWFLLSLRDCCYAWHPTD